MMATIQLFFNVTIRGNDPTWYEHLTAALKNYCATEQVEIIRKDEKFAQIYISYELKNASLDEIELIVTNTETAITGVNIHLPTSVTGIADPYHASGISIPLEESLKKIKGVLGGGISSNGEIKIELDHFAKDKQAVVEEIFRNLPLKMDNL
ncbi:hypothetical protein GCM10027036_03970 [Flavihumibacter cheonanensis]|uniref:hypothetical protein n=1 Tax=Flavihumibacter TaxID=1004301 RepID=UPI001EF7E3BC|nr:MULTISPECIES: hypothetical protein [Flavihumibacter]MCG7752159.1 hypothetical protein [Flavihumibacter cheonanensis]